MVDGPQNGGHKQQFGELYSQIQAKYGEKPEKAREIKKTLGKDDFLKIMITQMKNQDPTNPFKAEQMAAEIAQFTSVEQLQNVNQNLNKMATQNKPLEQMAMMNIIGKTVTIDRERFPHVEGQADTVSFHIPENAKDVKVTIMTEAGEDVVTKELGPQKSGEVSFNWDGIKSNTLPAKSGNYRLRVEAVDNQEKTISTNPQAKARVIGVSFEGSEPVFLIGDATRQEKITMRNIIRIEMDTAPTPGAPSHGGITPIVQNAAKSSNPNFISFQKGVGSENFNPAANPQAAQAIQKFQQAQTAQAAPPVATVPPAAPLAPEEKGFPNGLHD